MKIILEIVLLTILFVPISSLAQSIQFAEVLPQSPNPTNLIDFDLVAQGEVAFADIDGDGDEDVLITGNPFYVGGVVTIANLYVNDGIGNYSLVSGTPFYGTTYGTVDFADVDGDGDMDVLITGLNNEDVLSFLVAEIYLNDGSGNFSILLGTPFETVFYSATEFADIDGDGDLDVLITGLDMSDDRVSNLYINDGSGNYSLDPAPPFEKVQFGSIAFADIDNDADLDVIISGLSDAGPITKLYLNDGLGVFTEDEINSFTGVLFSAIAFADMDNDSDPDLVITGRNSSEQCISELYVNIGDGSGFFIEDESVPFAGANIGAINVSDFDGDNVNDIIITGEDYESGERLTKLYLNDGIGNFTLDISSWFENAAFSSVAVSDIDGDDDIDLLITGRNFINHNFTRLYINNGSAEFDWAARVFNDGVQESASKFGDIDNDGDEDLIITGAANPTTIDGKTELFLNDGLGYFTQVNSIPFDQIMQGDIEFLDIENDGDLDLLVTGWGGFYVGNIAKLYKNDGTGEFTEILSTPFSPVVFSNVAVGDVDNDGDIDIVISGRNLDNDSSTKLYLNDGLGNYTFEASSLFPVQNGTIEFADVDNDSDLDIFVAGYSAVWPIPSSYVAKIYINDGAGNFDEVIDTPLEEGASRGDAKFADMDLDGDVDLIVSGFNGTTRYTKLYENSGSGNFSELTEVDFPQLGSSSILFSDLDGDNAPDILMTGVSYPLIEIETVLFKNDGTGNFSLIESTPFDNVTNGSISATDIDGDSDLDIFMTGLLRNFYTISKIYRNTTTVGLDEYGNNSSIQLYPNPTSSLISIKFSEEQAFDWIEIHDNSGKLVYSTTINSVGSSVEVDLSELAKGSYFVKLVGAENVSVEKIIKN